MAALPRARLPFCCASNVITSYSIHYTKLYEEFLRDRTALGWNVIMPVLIVMGFAFLFSTGQEQLDTVGLHGPVATDSPLQPFLQTRYLEFIPVDDLANAIDKVDRHQLDLLLDRNNFV